MRNEGNGTMLDRTTIIYLGFRSSHGPRVVRGAPNNPNDSPRRILQP